MATLDSLPVEIVEQIGLFTIAHLSNRCGLNYERNYYNSQNHPERCWDCYLSRIAKDLGAWRLVSRGLCAKISRLFSEHCFGVWKISHLSDDLDEFHKRLDYDMFRLGLKHLMIVSPFCINYGYISFKEFVDPNYEPKHFLDEGKPILPAALAAIQASQNEKHVMRLASILRRLTNLKKITLRLGCYSIELPSIFSAIIDGQCTLETLNLHHGYVSGGAWGALDMSSDQLSQFAQLKALTIQVRSQDTLHFREKLSILLKLFENLLALRSLELGFFRILEENVWSLISIVHFPKLVNLNLAGVRTFRADLRHILFNHRNTLKTFRLSGVQLLDESWVDVIEDFKALPVLSDLYLYNLAFLNYAVHFADSQDVFCSCGVHEESDGVEEIELSLWIPAAQLNQSNWFHVQEDTLSVRDRIFESMQERIILTAHDFEFSAVIQEGLKCKGRPQPMQFLRAHFEDLN